MHNTIAIICDCDATLVKDTTEFLLEENKIVPKEFWKYIDENFVQKGWDPPQAYLNEILKLIPRSDIEAQKEKFSLGKNEEKNPVFKGKMIHPVSPEEMEYSLDPEEIEIIKFIGNSGVFQCISTIYQTLGFGRTKALYHLDNLLDKKLIVDQLSVVRETLYGLSREGRKYFVKNNLAE